MKKALSSYVRVFPLRVQDHHSGVERPELVVLMKEQLQACRVVGRNSKELIHSICQRIDIPEKRGTSVSWRSCICSISVSAVARG